MHIQPLSVSVSNDKSLCESTTTKQSQRKWTDETKRTALYCLSALLILISLVLFGISLLPQSVLPFAGVYFVIGAFVSFVAVGVMAFSYLLQAIRYIKNSRRATEAPELSPPPTFETVPVKTSPTSNQLLS